MSKFRPLMERIGYQFKATEALEIAFFHKSYGNERRTHKPLQVRDNERLEFLGDAVLDLAITEILLERYPDSTEGELSKLRASLVNERTLSALARELDLGAYIYLGKGEEQTKGREKDSILASTFEALVAAVFIDCGYQLTLKWVQTLFEQRLHTLQMPDTALDFKTRLQEIVQGKYRSTPRYELIQATGPDHEKVFEVHVLINNQAVAKGIGKNKKEAEQKAAEQALLEFRSSEEKK